MTQIDNAFDGPCETTQLVEQHGAAALDLCCRYQIESETLSIDLEGQTYRALYLLARGGTLADAIGCINPAHPFAHKVVDALASAASSLIGAGRSSRGAQFPLLS